MVELQKSSRVYLIAIAGTGMSALAGLLKDRGCEVAGSDVACYPPVSDLLRDLQVDVKLEYDPEHLRKFKPDYVVIGNFVRKDNPQAIDVLERGIPYGSLPSTLENYFLTKTYNIVVAGTHGKSTTATCISHLLKEGGRNPNFFIGAVSNNLGKSFEWSGGEDFVLEGDEYDTAFFDKESKFLHYRPKTLVWTSLEFDHADIFPSMERLELMFQKLLQILPGDGELIYCRDWERVHELSQKFCPSNVPKTSYGFHSEATHRILDFRESEEGVSFTLDGEPYRSTMPGRFNAQNMAASIIAARRRGLRPDQIRQGLANFKGLKRRQEVRIERKGYAVIDDFAHHPTAVREVLGALRKKYPTRKLCVFFEPRSNTTRRKFFQHEFVEAFQSADRVMLPEIFRKEALADEDRLDVAQLVSDLNRRGTKAAGPLSVDQMLIEAEALCRDGAWTFIVLSNGAFEGIHHRLISLIESL